MEENKIYHRIEFLSKAFEIDSTKRIEVFRFNSEVGSPYNTGYQVKGWDYEAKALKTDCSWGIYGFTKEQVEAGRSNYLFGTLCESLNSGKSMIFLKLEVDRTKIKYMDDSEICFSECNVIGKLSFSDLINEFPKYREGLGMYEEAIEKFNDETCDLRIEAIHALYDAHYPAENNWKTPNRSKIHDLTHCIRVARNARILESELNVNSKVLRLFAYYHDFCRENEGLDPEHGFRASLLIEKIRDLKLLDLNEKEFEQLIFACKHHTDLITTNDETVNACFDCDRLDLTRIGVILDPSKMATEIGMFYARNQDKFIEKTESLVF